jgi:hypothetical protein
MTQATLFSNVGQAQNQAGPYVPAGTVVNTGAPTTHYSCVLTVTPSTGWCEATVGGGPDGVNFPEQCDLFVAPGGTGTIEFGHRTYSGGPGGAVGGTQYFQAEVMSLGPPGATATMVIKY